MGHESQIEPWLAHDQRSACWFHKSLASSQIEYENHRGRTHKRYAVVRSIPSLWSGMREQSCSIPRGLKINKKSTKIQPKAKCFLLTFLLIELYRHRASRTLTTIESTSHLQGYCQMQACILETSPNCCKSDEAQNKPRLHLAPTAQTKFASFDVSPEPLYLAVCG